MAAPTKSPALEVSDWLYADLQMRADECGLTVDDLAHALLLGAITMFAETADLAAKKAESILRDATVAGFTIGYTSRAVKQRVLGGKDHRDAARTHFEPLAERLTEWEGLIVERTLTHKFRSYKGMTMRRNTMCQV